MDLFDFLLLGIALINLIACPIVAVCLAASARQNRALHERNAAQAAMIRSLEWRIKNPQQAADQDFIAGTQWERETRELEPNTAPLELNRIRGADVANLGRKMAAEPLGQIMREGEEFMTNRVRVEHQSIADNYSGHRVGEVRADCPACTAKGRDDLDARCG